MADDAARQEAERPTCRTFDDHGDSICDRPARFIVWGHLYPKSAKGPKCGYHTPRGALLPSGFGAPAIYEIPAEAAQPVVVTAEQVDAAAASLYRTKVLDEWGLTEANWHAWGDAGDPIMRDHIAPHWRKHARAALAALGITVTEEAS